MIFRMTSTFRWTMMLGLAWVGGLFISCNTQLEVEHRIDLYLHDSLSSDRGEYDSLQIDIVSSTGTVIQPNVFHGPYKAEVTGGVLKGLLLGATVPSEFDISIKAFTGDDTVLVKISVNDGVPGAVVRIDTLQPNPNPTQNRDPNRLTLSDSILILGDSSPPHQVFYTLAPDSATGIIRFRSKDSLIAEVDGFGLITPRAVGETQIIAHVEGFPLIADTVKVKVIVPPAIDQVDFTRPAPLLYVGAPAIQLKVTHQPANLTPVLVFKSSDTSTIEVNAAGEIKAKAEGSALITVTTFGSAPATDTLTIRALRDAPVIDAGITQNVDVGQPVHIKVKVTQEFGTLVLFWDFNADSEPEGQTTQDTATATHTYATEGEYNAVFTAKDGEGNITIQTVRIRVGKTTPLIIITNPKQDTLVNSPSFRVAFTSDGTSKTQDFTLREGVNTLTVKDSNATGKDSASVKVTLDSKAPVVKITSPAKGAVTNLPEIDVAWTVDSVVQTTSPKENLVGKQGPITIFRDFIDSAGNRGSDSISITRDTVPPTTPTFNSSLTTTSPTKNKKPTWAWVSSGTNGGGSGTFKWSIASLTPSPVVGTETQFTAEIDLPDGIYTLTLQERDAAGNWSNPVTRDISILTTGALVKITSPIRGSQFNARSGVIAVAWSVNDSLQTTSLSDTLTVQGSNLIRREFKDASNNLTFDTMTVIWDTLAPRVAISSPLNGAWLKDLIVPVTWTVETVTQTSKTSDTLSGADGLKTITRTATDAAGNTGSASITVNLDRVAPAVPVVSVDPPSPTTDQTPTWTWTGTGPFEYRYGTTNPPTTNVTAVNGGNTFTPMTNLAAGTWYFQVRARDEAGNWSAWSQVSTLVIEFTPPSILMPAARQHVRMVNGIAYKYTSKLRKIIELNFTFGFGHPLGKPIITTAMDRIASDYSTVGYPITVQHFTGANSGTSIGNIPAFTLTDLLAGQVIVANNISQFGDAALGSQKQTAIQTAIETDGRGYIGIHGSGDNEGSAWPWFTNSLHPVNYSGHGNRIMAPVYKDIGQGKHVVLQGILETNTTIAADVPDELDAGGNEKVASNIPVRQMKSECHRFGRDISRDIAYQNKVTPLLKYDPRNLSTADVPAQFRRSGGNLFTYIYEVGKGKTSFFPSGHENDELLDASTGFDGGAGDLDRYLAQLMFYLAGYDSTICDASCNGLELVNDKLQLVSPTPAGATGMKSGVGDTHSNIHFDPNQVAFTSIGQVNYKAVVTDLSGQVVDQIEGRGTVQYVFDSKPFKSGIYLLKVSVGNKMTCLKRYAIM